VGIPERYVLKLIETPRKSVDMRFDSHDGRAWHLPSDTSDDLYRWALAEIVHVRLEG
jgi:hypothetical protein